MGHMYIVNVGVSVRQWAQDRESGQDVCKSARGLVRAGTGDREGADKDNGVFLVCDRYWELQPSFLC
jgi:hypothetical protein